MSDKSKKSSKNNDLAVYQTEDGELQLKLDTGNETLWATQKQFSELFDVNVRTVNEHIKNIFKSGELIEGDSVIRKFRITGSDGKSYNTQHYNLDMLISVGYRVNSKTATKFRQWATKTLKQHITEGYTLNQHLFDKQRVSAETVINHIQQLTQGKTKIQASDVLELVKAFTYTWFSLQTYDENALPHKGKYTQTVDVQARDLYTALDELKTNLITKGEATALFAQEKQAGSLEGIIGSIMQSVFGEDAYPSIEEKAAHLLYFIIKNHPFNDGNKRSGAFSFVWFLQQANFAIKQRINPNTLTVLTLLIAESDPKQKEQMIGLVLQLLNVEQGL